MRSSIPTVTRVASRRLTLRQLPEHRSIHCQSTLLSPLGSTLRHPNSPSIPLCSYTHFSTLAPAPEKNTLTPQNSRFAAVNHARAYEFSMAGQHGQQLALAELEGRGRDDPPFDPFLEEELEEARLAEANAAVREEEDIPEAELVGEDEEIDDDNDDDDVEDVDDEVLQGSIYNNDGSLRRTKAERATLRAGAPAGGLFAILELAGSQHKITTDDLLIVNRLRPQKHFHVGSVHTLEDVMLVSSSHYTLVGMPYVRGAQVDLLVEEITMDAKVIVFRKRRRKNSQRKNGSRRDVTMLRVLDIRPPEAFQNQAHRERPPPAPLVKN
jgi:large subunit ribosomal protein L21